MRIRASSHSLQSKPVSAGVADVNRKKANHIHMARQIFTDQQKDLLRHSWNHVGKQGPSGIGTMIFKRIFERNIAIRRLFGFATTPLSRLPYEPNFESHARVFVAVLEGAIKNLDDLDNRYGPILVQHGKNHTKFSERGFKPDFWDVFAEAMTESAMEWVGPGKHRETVKAWTILVSYIVDKMRIGYEAEIRRIRKVNNGYNSCPPSPLGGSRDTSPSKQHNSPSPTNRHPANGDGFFVDYEDDSHKHHHHHHHSANLSRRNYYD